MSADQNATFPPVIETSSHLVPAIIPGMPIVVPGRKHRRWYRRKPVIVLACLLAIAGITAIAAMLYLNWQFAKINELSTPPPQVAGVVLDDSATAQVNTDFAQQALEVAQSGQPGQYVFDGQKLVLVTPTPETTSGLIPGSTNDVTQTPIPVETTAASTVVATSPALQPSSTLTAAPTTTPVPQSTSTQDAFAHAASEATLQSAEFQHLPTETATRIATVTPEAVEPTVPIATIPVNATGDTETVHATATLPVTVAASDNLQPAATLTPVDEDPVISLPDSASLPMPASFTLAPILPSEQGQMNILLMGVDAREGQAIDVGVRPDSLSVLHLDPATGSCRILAIPRDTRTELPGYGLSKVNHALAIGGVPYEMLVVEQLLGIQLDHYGLVDFSGIQQLVDTVGGVTVNNPVAFDHLGFSFAAGDITLNGEQALVYARYRYDGRGDFGRIERQQQVIRAIIDQASGMDIVQSAPGLLNAMEDHFKTDLSPTDLISLATTYRSSCTAETLEVSHLEGDVATFLDPLLNMNLSYVVISDDELKAKVEWLLNGD